MIKNIRVRAQDRFGGNCIEDALSLTANGPALLEMDFMLNKRGEFISGHDYNAYPYVTGGIPNVLDPYRVRNAKGGRPATLASLLLYLPPETRLFVDLKDTHNPGRSVMVMDAVVQNILAARRVSDVVIMAYIEHVGLFEGARAADIRCCLKRGERVSASSAPYSEDEALSWVELAHESGADYICYPSPPAYERFATACQDAGITLLVPVEIPDFRRRIGAHLKNGTTHFITPYADDVLEDIAAAMNSDAGKEQQQC